MNNKKIGMVMILISVILGVLIILTEIQLEQIVRGICQCSHSSNYILVGTHISIGIVFSLLSLGLYLIFFEKGEKAILTRLEEEKNKKIEESKFDILLKGLDKEEQIVLKAVKEQDGISQSTLVLRTNIHKSKLSIILNDLEKKQLLKKIKKGKINYIHLKIVL